MCLSDGALAATLGVVEHAHRKVERLAGFGITGSGEWLSETKRNIRNKGTDRVAYLEDLVKRTRRNYR